MSARVTVVDRGADSLEARLRRLAEKKLAVKVGVIGDDAAASYETGQTVGEIATIHEYGLGVPRRSFIRDAVDENEGKIKGRLRAVAKRQKEGRGDLKRDLEAVGLVIAGEMQTRIARGISPANAPATIDAKGSDKPLIDTGQLRSSITAEVVPADEVEGAV